VALRADERGQSIGIVRLFLSLLVGLILAWLVDVITSPILSRASAAGETSAATQGTTWLQAGIGSLFLWFLIIAVFGVIALAVYQREVLG